MQGKKNVPMTRIRERAPEDKWMKDAKVPPTPVNPTNPGVIDAVELYRARQAEVDQQAPEAPAVEAYDGANAQALERRTAAAAAEASRADKLAAEKVQLEEKLVLTDKALTEAKDGLENARGNVKTLKKDLTSEKAKATKAGKEAEAAKVKIKELEKAKVVKEEVEVEVYPDKIVVEEITNVIRKGAALVIKTMVTMDNESVPLTIRAPFKKMKAAVDKAGGNEE